MAIQASGGTSDRVGGSVRAQSDSTWLVKAIVAGVVAGVVMAMFAMMVAALAGMGLWAPPRGITALVFGTQRSGAGFAVRPVVTGMMLHMMPSAAFGVGYALIVGNAASRLALGAKAVIGIMLGVALWTINTYALAGFLNGREVFTSAHAAWVWFAGQVMFGVVLGLFYSAWRHGHTALQA